MPQSDARSQLTAHKRVRVLSFKPISIARYLPAGLLLLYLTGFVVNKLGAGRAVLGRGEQKADDVKPPILAQSYQRPESRLIFDLYYVVKKLF